MRIGVDYSLATATQRGMGRYIREIVKCLMDIDAENEYFLYTYYPIVLEKLNGKFHERHIPVKNEILSEQIFLPLLAKKDALDVLWCPGNTFPLFLHSSIRLVVTIHDLIFLNPIWFVEKHSSFRQKIGQLYRKFIIKCGKNRINSVLTVSKYSAEQIKLLLGIDKVSITYNRIDNFYKLKQQIAIDKKESDFYFTVSGDAPSKNLLSLIEIFKNYFPNENLYIAGVPQFSELRKLGSGNILFLPMGLDDSEMIAYYSNCQAFIFLSLQEGFGIPILEAMACGAKIVCSDTTSLPEVLGNQGILVNPLDVEAVITAIKNIVNCKIDFVEREKFIKKFLKWNDSAVIVHNLLVETIS